jgi:hypothetical protein
MIKNKEIRKVSLPIRNNLFLLDNNTQKKPITYFRNNEITFKPYKEKANEDFQNTNFNFLKNFKLKNPTTLKDKNKNKNFNFIKREKKKSLEINFIDLNNSSDLKIQKFEFLPKIAYRTRHLISKSQINFNSILSENNNFNKKNSIKAAKNSSVPKSKQSRRVVFTKCVNDNENFEIFGKSQEINKFLGKEDINNCYNNSTLKSYLSLNYNQKNNNLANAFGNNNNVKNQFQNIGDAFFNKNENLKNNNLSILAIDANNNVDSEASLLVQNNNNCRNQVILLNNKNKNCKEEYIQIQENIFSNYTNINSDMKENPENKSINNNNSNSNIWPNLDKTPIKPKKIKTHFRNLSTNIKTLDLNCIGIYDKIPNASTDRIDLFENEISKKTESKESSINQNYYENNINNTKNDFYKEKYLIENCNLNIHETFFPYKVDFLKENSNNKNTLYRKSIINSSCNASTNTNFFKKKLKDVNNLFNIGQQTEKLHLYCKQKAEFR